MTGSFIKEEEPYFPFQFGLEWWGRTFQNLGIDFKGGSVIEISYVEKNTDIKIS
jgi:preprotein translocase subunit SecF